MTSSADKKPCPFVKIKNLTELLTFLNKMTTYSVSSECVLPQGVVDGLYFLQQTEYPVSK